MRRTTDMYTSGKVGADDLAYVKTHPTGDIDQPQKQPVPRTDTRYFCCASVTRHDALS
jgi:hypothetical protein